MPVQRGITVGSDAVLELYDGFTANVLEGTFSIFLNERTKFFEPPKGMTAEDRRVFLEKFLDRLTDQGDCSVYYIRVHEVSPKGAIDKNSAYIVALPFRVIEMPPEMAAGGAIQPYYNFPARPADTSALEKKIDDLVALAAKQQEQILLLMESEDDYEDEKPKGLAGQLSGLLENEQIIGALAQSVGPFITKFLSGFMQQQPGQPHTQILNGMPKQKEHFTPEVAAEEIDLQLLDESLTRLSKHLNLNTAIPKLADYLDKNPDKAGFIMSFIN